MSNQSPENKHLEDSMATVRAIFEKVVARVAAIKPGEKRPATELAQEIAKEYGMTGPQLYPTLKFILNEKYPGVEIRKGAHGGVYKLDPNKPAKVVAAPAVATPPTATVVLDSSSVVNFDEDSAEAMASEKEVQPIVNT